jgi:ubiquinone/menaquinone biosynthesis C-methylase UbiE
VRDVELPDFYETVARDAAALAVRGRGLWADLGCGAGGVGLALARQSKSTVLLVDPNPDALGEAVRAAQAQGVSERVVCLVARAEHLPLVDNYLDLVVSRGSVFFWEDAARGIREVHRVLRPGGCAMIGGGCGSGYPDWARREFMRRRCEDVSEQGADALARFAEKRSPDTFHRLAVSAGLSHFEIVTDTGSVASEAGEGLGIWLRFTKEAQHGT